MNHTTEMCMMRDEDKTQVQHVQGRHPRQMLHPVPHTTNSVIMCMLLSGFKQNEYVFYNCQIRTVDFKCYVWLFLKTK